MQTIEFTVVGVPVAKGRPRMTKRGIKPYTPEKTVAYENLVKLEFQSQCDFKFADDAQLWVNILFVFPIPKSASKKRRALMIDGVERPTKKPDIDNCIKAILDALNGVAYKDDTQVVSVTASKVYGNYPRADVRISGVDTNE